MAKKDFSKLSELLPKVVNQYNLSRQVSGALVCHHFRKVARNLWDDAVHECLDPESYRNGVLTVVAADAGWAQQIHFKRVVIVEALNVACPEHEVKKVVVRVKG